MSFLSGARGMGRQGIRFGRCHSGGGEGCMPPLFPQCPPLTGRVWCASQGGPPPPNHPLARRSARRFMPACRKLHACYTLRQHGAARFQHQKHYHTFVSIHSASQMANADRLSHLISSDFDCINMSMTLPKVEYYESDSIPP